MHGRKALLGIIGVALVAALAGTAIASQRVSIDSEVTLAANPADCSQGQCSAMAWHGQVKSSKHACEVQRTVKVFGLPGKLVGKDTTNSHGKWRFKTNPDPGRFYAKVLRREDGVVCRSDRSKTLDHH